jgi:hypothetical protein
MAIILCDEYGKPCTTHISDLSGNASKKKPVSKSYLGLFRWQQVDCMQADTPWQHQLLNPQHLTNLWCFKFSLNDWLNLCNIYQDDRQLQHFNVSENPFLFNI